MTVLFDGLAAKSKTTCAVVVVPVVVIVVGTPGVPVRQSGCALRSET